MTGDPLEAYSYARGQGVGDGSNIQISQKDFGWRNVETMERSIRTDWKSMWNRADGKWHHSRPCTRARDSAEKLEEIKPAE